MVQSCCTAAMRAQIAVLWTKGENIGILQMKKRLLQDTARSSYSTMHAAQQESEDRTAVEPIVQFKHEHMIGT